MYQFVELNIVNTIKFQRYLENGLQNTISFFINNMEDEYLFELDYKDIIFQSWTLKWCVGHVKKLLEVLAALKKIHLDEHPKDNVFTEEYLQQWYSQINFLLHTLSKMINGTDNLQGLLHFVLATNFTQHLTNNKQHSLHLNFP